jgi:predicted negative regulator of RcsB-dependent stress response
MLETFGNISPESDYAYMIHVFIARHRIEQEAFDRALEHLYTAERIDADAWSHQMRL